MDIEQKQAELIDQFVKQASALKGSALGSLVAEATSNPSLFAFSEILAVPTVLEVRITLLCLIVYCLLLIFGHYSIADKTSFEDFQLFPLFLAEYDAPTLLLCV